MAIVHTTGTTLPMVSMALALAGYGMSGWLGKTWLRMLGALVIAAGLAWAVPQVYAVVIGCWWDCWIDAFIW